MRLGEFHQDLRRCEANHGCENTIVIGDFNVNPFEKACISARNMHAIPYKEEVFDRNNRVVNERPRSIFYNPTWKFIGRTAPPYTTYYSNQSGKAINYYWYSFDQVIIRPQLIRAFDEEKLAIITATGNHSLTKKGNKPDETKYSDHLPLFCVLKEELI